MGLMSNVLPVNVKIFYNTRTKMRENASFSSTYEHHRLYLPNSTSCSRRFQAQAILAESYHFLCQAQHSMKGDKCAVKN
jgi:hypothetical protein